MSSSRSLALSSSRAPSAASPSSPRSAVLRTGERRGEPRAGPITTGRHRQGGSRGARGEHAGAEGYVAVGDVHSKKILSRQLSRPTIPLSVR